MTSFDLTRFAGWSAYLSAAATVLGIASLIAFFTVGQPFGTINDIFSVVIALSSMVVLYALHQIHQQGAPLINLAVFAVGVSALLVAAVLQTLLILNVITFAQTAVIVPLAFGFFGAALVVYGRLSLANGLLPARLAWMSIIAGVGYVLVITGFILGGQEHPLAAIGGLVTVIVYPGWAIWFGRLLLSGRFAIQGNVNL